ncbi:hypothetical protein BDV93DRAFT_511759 [Ceratobasidium sp. AG-I]|nr:hypothetical protein BDV93DRAFT_511759 [Ceratobasidium sp. AG-I]
MASQTPVGQLRQRRHRIANIQLQPSIAKYDISLKILVDEQEPRRLPAIQRAMWTWILAWNFEVKRIGTLHYTIATITNQAAISLELDTKQFTAVLSFPTSEEALHAPTTALAGAQAMEKKTRLLERLGSTRDAFKTILDFGGAVAEIHPAARMVFKTLERQEQCDANVEKLVVGLASMLPLVELVKTAASLPQLRNTVETMMNLVEDASRFIVEYKSDAGPGKYLHMPRETQTD